MTNAFSSDERFRDLTCAALGAHGSASPSGKVTLNTSSATNLGVELTADETYFLIGSEAMCVCSETALGNANADTDDRVIPAWYPWPFVPVGTAVFVSAINVSVAGDAWIVDASGHLV